MAVRLSIPQETSHQGRTEQGLALQANIFETTKGIRFLALPQHSPRDEEQIRHNSVAMLD